MKKKNILKECRDFNRIIQNSKPFKYKDYFIYLERCNNNDYKFGLSVGKKVGNAVTRNKVKRQLRNIIDQKVYQNNFNCIIIVSKSVLNKTFDEMKSNLYQAFKTLNILKEDINEE